MLRVWQRKGGEILKVRVRAFAQFRDIVGAERTVEAGEGTGTTGLLRIVAGESPVALEALFDNDGAVRGHVIVMVNGKRVAKGEDRQLHDGDEVAVFPPVAGG